MTIPADQEVVAIGYTATASANFSRPANTTQYASGDLVADNPTAGSVTPLDFAAARRSGHTGLIRGAKLRKSGTSTTNASFRIHLFATSPAVSNGDNSAFQPTDKDIWLGAIDITVDLACADGAVGRGVPNQGTEIFFDTPDSDLSVYGLLEARGAYTPGSAEIFEVELEIFQD